jgi:hypothetical protein
MIEISYHACFVLAFIALVLALGSVAVGFVLGMVAVRHLPCRQLQEYMLTIYDSHKKLKHPNFDCPHFAFKD